MAFVFKLQGVGGICRWMVTGMSDFAAARVHLERAFDYLDGNDEISKNAREALDLLIEAVATAEFSRSKAAVLLHPSARGQRTRHPFRDQNR